MEASSNVRLSDRINNSICALYSASRLSNLILFLFVAGIACVWAVSGYAQVACAERAEVLKNLEEKFDERPMAAGLTSEGGLVEVVKTADGSTWTILVTSPDGYTCIVAVGEGWREHEQVADGPQI